MAPPVAQATPPNHVEQGAVLAIVGAVLVALGVPASVAALRRGRRRGWRPGVSE